MALLVSLREYTASTTYLHRQLFTASVSHKLARLLLHVLCGAGGLIDGLAHLLPLPVALLEDRLVAVLHCLIVGLLLEGYGAGLLKCLLTHLLLGGLELGDISVVALLLTASVSHKLAWLLLHVLGGAGGLID